jgi:hypothetical protein
MGDVNIGITVAGTPDVTLGGSDDKGKVAEWGIPVATASALGVSLSHLVAAASTNAGTVKASAGQLYGVVVFNAAIYPVYIKFYNKASSPTVGSDTVVKVIGVQGGTSHIEQWPTGIPFTTGIARAIVKGIADSDATAVLASDCVVDFHYL